MLTVAPKIRPSLDPEFMPAALWQRAYQELVDKDSGARPFAMVLMRPDGTVFRHDSRVLGASSPAAALTLIYAERLLKFLLWMKGGSQVFVAGADEIAVALAKIYSPAGASVRLRVHGREGIWAPVLTGGVVVRPSPDCSGNQFADGSSP
jgi:hypothetical protein